LCLVAFYRSGTYWDLTSRHFGFSFCVSSFILQCFRSSRNIPNCAESVV
jgi:hypothetical protein